MTIDWKRACILFSIVSVMLPSDADAQSRIDLAGQWQVRIDRDDEYAPATSEDEQNASTFQSVQLPGAIRDSGLGEPVGPNTRWIANDRPELLERPEYAKYQDPSQFKIPFWLQPERHYTGPAYYRRAVTVPASWAGQRVLLTLERPHWQTKVWIDGKHAGDDDSLSTPHVYDLTKHLTPGNHTLTIRVDNSLASLDVGVNSHSVSDHTQSAWHGIVGKLELHAEPQLAISSVQAFPSTDARSAKVLVQLAGITSARPDDSITVSVSQDDQVLGTQRISIRAASQNATINCTVPFNRPADRWDEFNPRLCMLEVSLTADTHSETVKRVQFGIRHIKTRGTQFVLNDRPLFLRGTLECCIFPRTGYPPTDIGSWKRIVRICKSHGLNHIRFHSWCPPEAAFLAADELGFYYQVECSTWPNVSTSLGNGEPIDEWLYREGQRILDTYGNHPSFLLLAMGNEPGGPRRGAQYLEPWVEHFKSKTDRQLITSAAGWPIIKQNEFHVTPGPRIQQWGQGLGSRINALPPATVADYREFISRYNVPIISHEIGQWCVFPNFEEMDKYTGALKPRNFEIFRELLHQAQMGDQAHDFLMASGKLQTLCYKEEIESALRTPGFGGFQLLDLHDFPGQGTALVGVLDPFWDSKPYVTPDEFSQFCGPTTPIARMAKRTWMNDETFAAQIELCHFGPASIPAVTPHWRITRGGKMIQAGDLSTADIFTGKVSQLGKVELPLAIVKEPAKLTLQVWLEDNSQIHTNAWDFWVYPDRLHSAPAKDILVADWLDDEAKTHLDNGHAVVLLVDPMRVNCDLQIGFSSIFWNTAWTGGQAPHTLGVLCDPSHPALAAFPTDFHSDWQWWSIVSQSKPMVMDALPPELRPVVQVVPDWFRPQRLGLVFEARVGKGKLLVSSINLEDDLQTRPAARQLRNSLLHYAASDSFAPQTTVTIEALRGLFRSPTELQRLGTRIEAESEHHGYPAVNAMDGKPYAALAEIDILLAPE